MINYDVEWDYGRNGRESIEGRFNKSGLILTYTSLVLIMCFFIGSFYFEIDMVVKAYGEVNPLLHTHTVKNKFSGTISLVNLFNEGIVESGDILFAIDSTEEMYELRMKENDLRLLKRELFLLDILGESIEGNNKIIEFAKNEERDFLLNKYINEYKNFLLVESQVIKQIEKIETTINYLTEERKNNLIILDLIDSNVFNENKLDEKYYLKYKKYESECLVAMEKINELETNKRSNKVLFDNGVISKIDYDDSVSILKIAKENFRSYCINYKLELMSSVDHLEVEILDNEYELRCISQRGSELGLETLNRINKRIEINKRIINCNDNLRQKELEIERIKDIIESSVIKAPFSGKIDFGKELCVGDYIESGTDIGYVIPRSEDFYRVKLKVRNKDISKIKVGDKVKYKIDALPFKKFGMASGEVIRISATSYFDSRDNNDYYYVECSIPNVILSSYTGEKGMIKTGMQLEGQIVTKRKKLIYFLIERLGK